jgi:hypothetical protein
MRFSTFSLIVLFLLAVVSAFACCSTTSDYLNIGPGVTGALCSGVDVAKGCGLGPNPLPTNHLDIYNTSTSTTLTVDITRLIIGIPLAAGVTAPLASSEPHITGVDIYNPYPGSHSSFSTNIGASACGSLTSSSLLSAYSDACTGVGVDLLKGSNSENWANWSTAASNAASFALYYYDLHTLTDLTGHGLYDISLGSALPIGTIEIAFGYKAGDNAYCYLTGWTQAGQVQGIPEPASWLLVAGAGLALLGGRLYKTNRT